MDTTYIWYNYNGRCNGIEDMVAEGRSFNVNTNVPLFKYKIIEHVKDLFIERIVVSFVALELNSYSMQRSSTLLYQLSVKAFNSLTGKLEGFFRFTHDINYVVDTLNSDRGKEYTTASSTYLWHMSELATAFKCSNMDEDIYRFYEQHNRPIEGMINCSKTHFDNHYLHHLISTADDIIYNASPSWYMANKTKLLQPVVSALPKELDILSVCGMNECEVSPKLLQRLSHSAFSGRLFLFQANYNPVFPIDNTVIFNSDINSNYALLKVINYLETLPYTDVTFSCDESGKVKTICTYNRYVQVTPNRTNDTDVKQLPTSMLACLEAWIRPLISTASRFRINVTKTWLEEVYIEIVIDDSTLYKYYFDLALMGLGSPGIISDLPGYNRIH